VAVFIRTVSSGERAHAQRTWSGSQTAASRANHSVIDDLWTVGLDDDDATG
jgi:hypothetical protein